MSCIQTPAGVLVTHSCEEPDAAAYFAAHFSLSHFWWFFTYLLAGWSSASLGLPKSYLVMAVLCSLSLLLVAIFFPHED